MKITLKKDILLTSSEVGRAGETHTVTKELGLHFVREGFADEVGEDGKAKPEDPLKRETKPLATSFKTK